MSSAVRGLISSRTGALDPRGMGIASPILWPAFLTLLVTGPWLAGGYIFATDWPGPRRFDFPANLYGPAPLEAALAGISRVTSGEFTGKGLVVGLLFVAALTAYRAAPIEGFVPGAVASTVYLVNPFVFGRLNYGQLYLLTGYALMPWVALRLRRLLEDPSPTAGLVLALAVALVGAVSSHLVLVALVLVGALVPTYVIAEGNRLEYSRRAGLSLLVAAVATLVASSYWVVPLVMSRGAIANAVAGFTNADSKVFAAVRDPNLGLIPNLLGLYGFWAESTGRFTSMKAFVPTWPAILVLMLVVGGMGVVGAFQQRRRHLGAWVVGLLIAAAIGLLLEMGVSSPVTRGLIMWLDATFPVYRGMRDAGKWAALLAIVYSQLLALGVATILGWIRALPREGVSKEWLGAVATGLLLALPLYYGNGLLFGMHGEIKPSQYPPGWYLADHQLASDAHPGRTLFLPWHEYMTLSFVRNQNSAVASPAPTFFSVPILASTNPELFGKPPPTDPDQQAISSLVKEGVKGNWATVLVGSHVKYILVVREVDWRSYSYLDAQPDIFKIGDYGSIVVYRNQLVP